MNGCKLQNLITAMTTSKTYIKPHESNAVNLYVKYYWCSLDPISADSVSAVYRSPGKNLKIKEKNGS
jgi:hypothetical protein